MPKSRSRKTKPKPQRAKGHGIVSMAQVRTRAAFDALEGTFVHWVAREMDLESNIAVALAREIHAFLAFHAQLTGKFSVTEFTNVEFQAALEMMEDARREEPSMFNTTAVVDIFLHFLKENELWSGTELAFAQVHALTDHGESESEDDIDLPEVDDEQAITYFNSMPLVRYARNLLAWIGDGREVTATGVLKLKDVVAAAALVGETVRTASNRSSASLQEEPVATSVPMVRSMREIELLDFLWLSMLDNELIRTTTTKVLPAGNTSSFLDERPTPESRELIESFIGTYLRVCGQYIFESYGVFGREVRGRLMQLLDAAMYPELQPEVLPELEGMEHFADRIIHSRMQEFAALGIVEIDTHYRVPVELAPSIDMYTLFVGFQEMAASEEGGKLLEQLASEGRRQDSTTPSSKDSVLPGKLAGKSLRLRADLEYTEPSIWRQLEVPASMKLSDLHRTLQTAFGWDGSHLHDFEQKSRGQILRYSDELGDETDTLDEYEFSVGQLAGSRKRSFYYNYDYGDSWRLKIVVEDVFDTPSGQVVRCTDGRMRAPVDDIGGVPGWYRAIEVVADPNHPEYEHICDMLELEPGDPFDPKEFSAEKIDQQLARMLK